MKRKLWLLSLFILLAGVGMVIAFGIGMSVIIGMIVILAIIFTLIAYSMKSGKEGGSEMEEDKHGFEHQRDVRATALGCYGPEAEEEKFGYEQASPQESSKQQKPPQ